VDARAVETVIARRRRGTDPRGRGDDRQMKSNAYSMRPAARDTVPVSGCNG